MKQILLLVGAKLEHIIARLAQESAEKMAEEDLNTQVVGNMGRRKEQDAKRVKPSDEYFWFNRPALVLDLLHFTLFQNSFEIAFFFWILVSAYTINFSFKSKQTQFSTVSFVVEGKKNQCEVSLSHINVYLTLSSSLLQCTYGFDSCIMEKLGYIIPRLVMG